MIFMVFPLCTELTVCSTDVRIREYVVWCGVLNGIHSVMHIAIRDTHCGMLECTS